MIIDAHAHLWKKQDGLVNGKPVTPLANGKSDFGGEIRQMVPPFMTDGVNSPERLLANMDYAEVNGAVITQEEIDGNQNGYLQAAKLKHPVRLKICSLYREGWPLETAGFDGIKICAGRLQEADLTKHAHVFEQAQRNGQFISVDLADGARQTGAMEEIISAYPDLRIAIGHFGMVTQPDWTEQIKLARHKNVRIESGGITWLFHSEFYPYPSAVKAVQEAASICGYDKLMWGSDYPRTMVEITYKMSYDFIANSNCLAETEKEKFLYQNAFDFYGFEAFEQLPKLKNMLED